LTEKVSDCVQEVFPALAIVVIRFSFDVSKEEEVARGKVRVVSGMRQPFGFGSPDSILEITSNCEDVYCSYESPILSKSYSDSFI
jgi:hypothetical protein